MRDRIVFAYNCEFIVHIIFYPTVLFIISFIYLLFSFSVVYKFSLFQFGIQLHAHLEVQILHLGVQICTL